MDLARGAIARRQAVDWSHHDMERLAQEIDRTVAPYPVSMRACCVRHHLQAPRSPWPLRRKLERARELRQGGRIARRLLA